MNVGVTGRRSKKVIKSNWASSTAVIIKLHAVTVLLEYDCSTKYFDLNTHTQKIWLIYLQFLQTAYNLKHI